MVLRPENGLCRIHSYAKSTSRSVCYELGATTIIENEKAGTSTGRAIGSIVGANLASYTAELGGKESVSRCVF
jgi:hypothetical protein